MTRILFQILKVLVLLLLFGLLAGGCYLLALWRGWPLWMGGAVFAGILAGVFLVLFLRRLYFRRREKRFVRRVIDHDESVIQAAAQAEQPQLRELQARWARAVETLRRSKLRLRGDPLYVLPWYMILGETGSGKTTAVKQADLSAIQTDLTDTSPAGPAGLGSTRNVDWWFFEQAVILDTAGRYAIPQDKGVDSSEWEEFLALLTRYRRKEPLDGLVVTVAADTLLSQSRQKLAEYGLSLRRRIDEMMQSMGARFPVYVLVTKLDQVLGLSSLLDLLSEDEARQAMGLALDGPISEPDKTAWDAVEQVSNRLRELRLPLLLQAQSAHPGAFLLPLELTALAPGLAGFMRGCFGPNPYTETPFLRGIFFSSARQSGRARTSLLHTTRLFADSLEVPQPQSERGMFLTDLFASILPRDRGIFAPLKSFLHWRASARNLALTAWLLLAFCLAGVLSYSYVQTRESLEMVAEPFPRPPQITHEIDQDLYRLSLFAESIKLLEEHSGPVWMRRMGFDHAHRAGKELKKTHVDLFQHQVLFPLDQELNQTFSRMDSKERSQNIRLYITYAVWRLNMIQGQLDGHTPDSFALPVDDILALVLGGRMPEIAPMFENAYVSYLQWVGVRQVLQAEADELRMWLNRLIAQEGTGLHWLVDWAREQQDLDPVTLGDFWEGSNWGRSTQAEVEGVFTPPGSAAIEDFLQQIKTATEDREAFARQEKRFRSWYADQYYQAWEDFAADFSQGQNRLLSPRDWQHQAAKMATLDNPYFQFLERIDTAFEPISDLQPSPALGLLAGDFLKLRQAVATQKKDVPLAKQLEQKGSQDARKLLGQVDSQALKSLEAQKKAAKALGTYMDALHNFLPPTSSTEKGYTFASKLYASNGSNSSTPLDDADAALLTLQGLMDAHKQSKLDNSETFWDVFQGPLTYMIAYLTNEASCQIQQLWENRVLSAVDNTPQSKLRQKLFGDQGLVLKFASKQAGPFLQRTRQGWSPKRIKDIAFPFESSFLRFLDTASQNVEAVQDKYTVHISGRPTDVNKNATVDPVSTRLELECADGVQELENFNYPVSRDFEWKPDTCRDVTLFIHFPDFSVRTAWTGPTGMQDFLQDFSGNSRTFQPDDFPKHQDKLQDLGLTSLTVNYDLKGARPVKALVHQNVPQPPEKISWCWNREDSQHPGGS
ncbi:MAG: type VI secretion protein IcmF/TssM N-terminal domain-containing protein [Desulfovermiculus sp.]